MKTIKTTVKFKVPCGLYCNHNPMKRSTPTTRCRFCTEVTKNVFVCVLHNEPLLTEGGVQIYKTFNCLAAVKEVSDE